MANISLHAAKVQKQDEFYTQLVDIENELKHYKKQLYGKVIFCNCDDPYESNFFKYFANNFNTLGLKKLIATSYVKSPIVGGQLQIFNIEGLKPDGKEPYKIEINEVPDLNNDGSISLDDVEYLLKHDKNAATPLKGDTKYNAGDFRSDECVKLLEEADIIITNPPFSLFREYVAQLMEYSKKFLIIGNDNSIKYKGIFEIIKENKIWLGYGRAKEFRKPDGSTQKFGNVGWFTNLEVEKRNQMLPLYKNYSTDEYPKYDNFDAIEVSRVSEIPKDYNGEMGVPISFLDKHNLKQFEIIDLLNRYTLFDSQKTNEDVRIRHSHTCNINGKAVYSRIVIKIKH